VEIKAYLTAQRILVEEHLDRFMLAEEPPFADHIRSMRYSLFVGGKRVRPILCLAAARAVAPHESDIDGQVMPVACALECIHTYSLIHDDLPAMDDDTLRRGKPTNHVVFGEAEAILAGDGLLTFAFDLLSDGGLSSLEPATRLEIVNTIARAAGPLGMVGGQFLDIDNENSETSYEMLRTIHRSKTGALITASVRSGALAGGANADQLRSLTEYGDNIGLAFQIVDDLLNVESTPEQLGKAVGSDAERGKATYPALFGLERTRTMAAEAVERGLAALKDFDHRAEPLRELARYIINRKR